MNALRRICLVVYSVLLLAAVGGITALAWNQDEQLDLNVGDLNMKAFIDASDGAKYALTGILAAIALIALISLLVALWPSRQRSGGALRIVQTDGGTVEVTSAAIESLLKDELESLSEVQSATPRVKLSGGAVDTYLDVQIEPSASIAHATKVLGATVEETLREQVGVTSIRRPVIRISYDELAARPVGARRSRAAMATEMRPQHDSAGESPAARLTDRPIYPDDPDRPPEAPKFVSPADEDSSKV
ncbi:MAG: alkaline shock response membrane anchor protein AmaP [Dehalococcoidia bacterium]